MGADCEGCEHQGGVTRPILSATHPIRHGRTCSGHPRLCFLRRRKQDMDGRDKRGHDDCRLHDAGCSRDCVA